MLASSCGRRDRSFGHERTCLRVALGLIAIDEMSYVPVADVSVFARGIGFDHTADARPVCDGIAPILEPCMIVLFLVARTIAVGRENAAEVSRCRVSPRRKIGVQSSHQLETDALCGLGPIAASARKGFRYQLSARWEARRPATRTCRP